MMGLWATLVTGVRVPSIWGAACLGVLLLQVVTPACSAAAAASTVDTAAVRMNLERKLAATESRYGKYDARVAEALDTLRSFHAGRGEYATAAPYAERAARIRERILDPGSPELASALERWGLVLADAGKLPDARPLLERVLSMRERSASGDDPAVAMALYNLAGTVRRLGEAALADSLTRRALDIQLRLGGPADPAVAATRVLLGILGMDKGALDEARVQFELAVPVLESTLPDTDPRLGRSLMSYANLLNLSGDMDRARPTYERAVSLLEASLGPDHPLVGIGLLNFALHCENNGSRGTAKKLLLRAIAILERKLGAAHPHVASALHNLASTLDNLGERQAAREAAERSLAIRHALFGPDHPNVLQTEANLAHILMNLGEYQQARLLLEHVLRAHEQSTRRDDTNLAVTLNVYGRDLLELGEYEAAVPFLRRSLEVKERSAGGEHPDLAIQLKDLALQALLVGQYPAAFDFALRAEKITRSAFRTAARRMPERDAIESLDARISGLSLALTSAAADSAPETYRRAWDAVIRSRALLLDEMAARHRVVAAAGDSQSQRLVVEWQQARDEAARLTIRGPADGGVDGHRKELAAALERREQAEDRLAAWSAQYRREFVDSRAGFAEVAATLSPEEALVGFVRYVDFGRAASLADSMRPPGRGGIEGTGIPEYMAFVLRGGTTTPAIHRVGTAARVDSIVAQWMRAITRTPLLSKQGRAARGDVAPGAVLASLLWEPIQRHISGARRVFIVPDGSLNLVNFAALPAKTGGYLLELEPLLHIVSTERDLVRWSVQVERGSGILAMGGPDFERLAVPAAVTPEIPDAAGATAPQPKVLRGRRSACGEFQSLKFDALPETQREVADIAASWNGSSLARSEGRCREQLGPAATEEAFKTMAPGRRFVHLATHGFFLGDGCGSAVPSGRGIAPPVDDADASFRNPLLLSGLALAGANRRHDASADQDDGILTAEEIAALDLSGVEFVALSACETGRGGVLPGEGVFGLRRAIEIAGAGSALVSLWQVEDAATRKWMASFYAARFREGLSFAEAARRASLRLLRSGEDRTSPFYWAAFAPVGDWR